MLAELIILLILFYQTYRAILFLHQLHYCKRLTAHLPSPPSWPIFGSLFHIERTPEGILRDLVERTNVSAANGKDMMHIWILHQCFCTPITGKALKSILDSSEEIVKGNEYDVLVPWLGRGLLISTGAKWRHRRRLLTPTFHFRMLDSYVTAMNRHSKVFVDQILPDLAGRGEVDLYPYIKRCTLDIICDTAMGKQIDSQHNPSQPYVTAVMDIIRLGFEVTTKPQYWSFAARVVSGLEHKMTKQVAVAHAFTLGVIKERIDLLNQGQVKPQERAFLDLLIEQMKKESLSLEDLREEVDTFMFEGYDTTASGLAWILWCFACNPDIQQRAFEEVNEVFGEDLDRDATREDLHRMEYVERCIKEALRLFPPVPFVMRKIQKDFQSGDHLIPKGVTMSIAPMAIHRNETLYPSAGTYNPDRFLPEAAAERHPFDYIPFSAGPRNCIGQRFALYEEKVIISWLLRKFRFETTRLLHDNVPLAEAILRPKLGCLVNVVQR